MQRIHDNGNQVTFNLYSGYDTEVPLAHARDERLLDELIEVAGDHPKIVVAHPYYLRTLVTGKTEFGRFGYDVCPSVSWDNPGHAARRANGNPTLPLFNAYGADLRTIQFCCTSGCCEGCRDSQAVQSWLMVSARHFLQSREGLRTWVELAESYWQQFVWSPYHARAEVEDQAARGASSVSSEASRAACSSASSPAAASRRTKPCTTPAATTPSK